MGDVAGDLVKEMVKLYCRYERFCLEGVASVVRQSNGIGTCFEAKAVQTARRRTLVMVAMQAYDSWSPDVKRSS